MTNNINHLPISSRLVISEPSEEARESTIVPLNGRLFRITIIKDDKKNLYLPKDWDRIEWLLSEMNTSYDDLDEAQRAQDFSSKKISSFELDTDKNKIRFTPDNQNQSIKLAKRIQKNIQPEITRLSQEVQKAQPVKKVKNPNHQKPQTLTPQKLQEAGKMLSDKDIAKALSTTQKGQFDFHCVKAENLDVNNLTAPANNVPLLLPLHIGPKKNGHWVGLYVDFANQKIAYYDSVGTRLSKRPAVEKIIGELNQKFFNGTATIESKVKGQQNNGVDCGRYVLDYFQSRVSGMSHDDYIKQTITSHQIIARMQPFMQGLAQDEAKEAFTDMIAQEGCIWFNDVQTKKSTSFMAPGYQAPVSIKRNGQLETYQNATAAGLAQHFANPADRALFAQLSSEKAEKKFDEMRAQIDPNYDQVQKEADFKRILKKKFKQNPHLAELLKATDNAYIHFRSRNDTQNETGCLLMEIRGGLGGQGRTPPPAALRQRFPQIQ